MGRCGRTIARARTVWQVVVGAESGGDDGLPVSAFAAASGSERSMTLRSDRSWKRLTGIITSRTSRSNDRLPAGAGLGGVVGGGERLAPRTRTRQETRMQGVITTIRAAHRRECWEAGAAIISRSALAAARRKGHEGSTASRLSVSPGGKERADLMRRTAESESARVIRRSAVRKLHGSASPLGRHEQKRCGGRRAFLMVP